MFIPKCVLLCGLILTLLLDPIAGRKSSGRHHSYPKSGGLSGGGHSGGGLSGGGHGYPSSGGHGYPSSGGHGYPSSGGHGNPSSGGHAYPSGGLSGGGHGYPSSGGNPAYPSSGNRGYPNSGQSGSQNNHGYPSSGGLSGGGHAYTNKPTYNYNNYHYSPPSQISYAPSHGGPPVSYPVYRGPPPTYVYQYKESGSKYGTLLAGLALMNLGTLGVAAYAVHKAGQSPGSGSSYKAQPGEVCKFAIKKENGFYEETRIDCQIISSFILNDMESKQSGTSGNNSTVTTTTTVTNVTIVNSTNVGSDQTTTAAPVLGNILYAMLPNGTLVPVNATGVNIPGMPETVANATLNETAAASPNNTGSSSVTVTTTTTNTTLVSALEVKGNPVEVTPGMKCYVMRHTPTSDMRKPVSCGVLQAYAEKSIQRSSASRNVPLFTIVAAIVAYCVV